MVKQHARRHGYAVLVIDRDARIAKELGSGDKLYATKENAVRARTRMIEKAKEERLYPDYYAIVKV